MNKCVYECGCVQRPHFSSGVTVALCACSKNTNTNKICDLCSNVKAGLTLRFQGQCLSSLLGVFLAETERK